MPESMNSGNAVARVLIVDRHPITRLGLTSLINGQNDMHVVGEADEGPRVLPGIKSQQPDVVVFELSLKGTDGLELIQQISCPPSGTRVLVLSLCDEKVYAPRALQAGAIAFVSKDADCDKFLAVLRRVLRGHAPDETMHSSDGRGSESRGLRSLLANLTDRELEVFEWLGHGLTVQQVASRLGITAKTVESHRERIKKKLAIRTGAELTLCAIRWVMER